MNATLLTTGVVCIIAAIVGGGLKAFGIEIPLLRSPLRQAILGGFGIILVLFSGALSPPPRPSTSGPTPPPVQKTKTVLSKTSFFPADFKPNNNGFIGPFCCTGKTATVSTADGRNVGFIYFYTWAGQAINTGNSSFVEDFGILVSGLTNLSDPSSPIQKSAVHFVAIEVAPGISKSTRAGALTFKVTIQEVTTEKLNERLYMDMGSIVIVVDVSEIAS